MGYTLRIGEAIAVTDYEERRAWMDVVIREDGAVLGAPPNPHNVSRSNELRPDPVAWSARMRLVGLVGLAATEHHCIPITQDHYATYERARAQWATRHTKPTRLIRFEHRLEHQLITPAESALCLASLTWLSWWSSWALENCRYPTLGTS